MTAGPRDAWRYGLLGLPLAFVALPLYVQLPAYYAAEFGVPLAALGALLLVVRLFDALVDPWLGRLVDRAYARSPRRVLVAGAFAAAMLATGFALTVLPPVRGSPALLAWSAATLAISFMAFSWLTVSHQAWGAMRGGDDLQQARLVGWREGFGLAGVVLASLLPSLAGWGTTALVLGVALAAGVAAWFTAAVPDARPAPAALPWWKPFANAGFRRLLAVFLVNGIATALPATLLLFFVQDRLQLPREMEALLLGTYFICGALSMPVWLRAVARFGLARSWLGGMLLSVAAFAWTSGLQAGDATAFLIVCALSGFALGSDLAFPGALLAGVIGASGERGRGEGVYFGWWNFAAKLNLALAAGLALPLLQWAGYTPGTRNAAALDALAAAYALLPCVLKLAAAALLYVTCIRMEEPLATTSSTTPDQHLRPAPRGVRGP